jgi:hypothetical protein
MLLREGSSPHPSSFLKSQHGPRYDLRCRPPLANSGKPFCFIGDRAAVALSSTLSPGNDEWAYAGTRGNLRRTHSDLMKIEVRGPDIFVAMRGTCFRMKYRKQEAPWLVALDYGPDDPGAKITQSEF